MAVDDWIKASFNPGEFLGVSVISSWEVIIICMVYIHAHAWVEEGSQDSPELVRSRVSLRQNTESKQQLNQATDRYVCTQHCMYSMYVSCMYKLEAKLESCVCADCTFSHARNDAGGRRRDGGGRG